MKAKILVYAFLAVILAAIHLAEAQQPGKIFRMGLLDLSDARSSAVRLEAFWQEIHRLGWIEGKNFTIESRFGEEKPGRLAEIASDLVRLKVDVIVCASTAAALAAKKGPLPFQL